MLNFLSLSLTPTTLIAVNQNLKVPKSFKLTVKANPKLYKYPELLKKKEKEEAKKVETAVLSTTTKVEARLKKRKGDDGNAADKDVEMASEKPNDANEESKDIEMKEQQEQADAKEYTLANPCRMLKQQE